MAKAKAKSTVAVNGDNMEALVRLDRDLRNASKFLGRKEARYLVDFYYQIQNFRKTSANVVRASDEEVEPNQVMFWLFDSTRKLEDNIKKALGEFAGDFKVGAGLQSITGIGPVISAGLLSQLDIRGCPTAGHFWRYAGLDPTVVWESKAECMIAVKKVLSEEEDRVFDADAAVQLYHEYARGPRPSKSSDVEAAHRLIDQYGAATVRAVMPTLARCHNRDSLGMLQVADFEKQFDRAVAFYIELCQKHTIAENAADSSPLNFSMVRILADRFGRNPYRLYKSAQGADGKGPTITSTATALCKRPWNTRLKTLLYKAADCFVKFQNHKDDFYGGLFVQRKEYETRNNEAGKLAHRAQEALTKFKYGADTKARQFYESGKLPPAHIHARALRWTEKIFLSHVHTAMYVDFHKEAPPQPYAFVHSTGDHRHYIDPPAGLMEAAGKSLTEMLD